MTPDHSLTATFEQHRLRLRGIAQRLLGSAHEADEVVQDAWLRMDRSEPGAIENRGAWLTAVVSRLALDRLRARVRRAETSLDQAAVDTQAAGGPESEAELADSVGAALMVVLNTLGPAERLAFVLHDSFAISFDEIGAVLGRSPCAAKQLASRARHMVRGTDPGAAHDPTRQRRIVDAFLNAARTGDLDALIALLAPDATLLADAAAVRMGSPAELRGAASVAGMFSGRALGASAVLLDGHVAIAWVIEGTPKVVWDVVYDHEHHITHIDMLATPSTLALLDLSAEPGVEG